MKLEKSSERKYYWVLTDTESGTVCTFKAGEFNETQEFVTVGATADPSVLASIAKEMTDWLVEHHYELIYQNGEECKRSMRKYIGAQLRQIREEKGYTLRDVAKLTGIAYNHIGRIERGEYNVTLDTLALLCDALDTDLRVL